MMQIKRLIFIFTYLESILFHKNQINVDLTHNLLLLQTNHMHPVLIGTIIWIILGLIIGWKVLDYVGKQSNPLRKTENQKIGLVAIIMIGISMWAMWACCYMHQMYPLIQPKIEF